MNPSFPSREFKSVLDGGSGPFATCGCCGREHHALDAANDIDALVELAKSHPEKYVLYPNTDMVDYFYLDGKIIPDTCPCDSLSKYERFMWKNREVWKRYLSMIKLTLQDTLESVNIPE